MTDDESIEIPWFDKTYDTGIRREEGRFRFLYGIFGAADVALLLMLITVYLTSPSSAGTDWLPLYLVIVGLCAMALAAGMDLTTWVWYVIISTFVFLAGVIATVAAIYFLLDQLDPYAANLFFALSFVILAALAVPWAIETTAIWRDSLETVHRKIQETTGPDVDRGDTETNTRAYGDRPAHGEPSHARTVWIAYRLADYAPRQGTLTRVADGTT